MSDTGAMGERAFELLASLEAALILTAEHGGGKISVSTFVAERDEFKAVQDFFHANQHSAALSPTNAGEVVQMPVDPSADMLRAGWLVEPGEDRVARARYAAVLAACPRLAHSDETAKLVSNAASDVLAERQRQINAEGWTVEHDDRHDDGALAKAAACYAAAPRIERSPWWDIWPWDLSWWKPKDRRRDLVRAGALIIAEIERLDRTALAKEPSNG